VGAVVLDSDGVLCVATSTGGLTNKLPGRIGVC
jgi:L-asparaginase